MPCRVDISDAERRQADFEQLLAKCDKLTAENDMLREAVLNLTRNRDFELEPSVIKIIAEDQTKHRTADLNRLKAVFTKSKDAEKLGLVMLANPKSPLEPQLGFSPDAY